MTSPKRKVPVRAVSFEAGDREPSPPIAALFLVRFDPKIGYTISWQRSLPELTLDGVVEYKSLPSGLHHVKEDLMYESKPAQHALVTLLQTVYFTHKNYAGISAFRNDPSAAAGNRKASFTSVGILLRHRRGRIGRGWVHAPALKGLAQDLFATPEKLDKLEKYWETHRENDESTELDPNHRDNARSLHVETRRPEISRSHPILSVEQFLDDFGPLLFTIYRAALLRRRILFIKKPPLCDVCHYVYVLSLISSIPPSLADSLSEVSPRRSNSLFTIGVHDLSPMSRQDSSPGMSEDDAKDEDGGEGWLACTSDEILATKQNFSDLQIRVPAEGESGSSSDTLWPSVTSSISQGPVKATQRDLRRYKILREGLSNLEQEFSKRYRDDEVDDDIDDAQLLQRHTERPLEILVPKEDTITESLPLAALAYDSFMWWASAGEQNLQIEDENAYDRELLMTASEVYDSDMAASTTSTSTHSHGLPSGGLQVAIIAYFHRMTTVVFEVLFDLIDSQTEESGPDNSEEQENCIVVQRADLVRMGLDEWSKRDRDFVVDLVQLYLHREAIVEGARVECCGIKLY